MPGWELDRPPTRPMSSIFYPTPFFCPSAVSPFIYCTFQFNLNLFFCGVSPPLQKQCRVSIIPNTSANVAESTLSLL